VDYYQILNVRPDCSYEELRKAFRKMSLRTHPDRFQGEERKKAEKEYQFVVKAFNTLKDRVQREKYDQKLTEDKSGAGSDQVLESRRKEGRQYEKAGLAHARNGSWEMAVEFLNKAVFLSPDASIYYQKGLAELHVQGKKKEALESLYKAIELDPYRVAFRVALIESLLKLEMKARAGKALQNALSFFPAEPKLLALQEIISGNRPARSGFKGLFSAFRGKN